MAPTLRPYRAEDRPEMARVFFRAVREGAAEFYTEAERAAWAPSPLPSDRPDKLLDQYCLVAEEGGRMTGFMSIDRDAELDMAFVLPEARGTGTAAALYEALIQWAKAQGIARLTVRASEYSHRFLMRRGWQVDGRERLEDGGQVYHLYLMSRSLP